MTRHCQQLNASYRVRQRDLPQVAVSYDVTTQAGLYSGGVTQKSGRAERKGGRELWDGERIKELRDARGLSREELATAAQISADDLGRHERNDAASNPSVDVLMRIGRALAVPPTALFQPKGAPIPRPEEASGRVERPEGDPLLAALAARLHENAPVEDSLRGDLLQALYVINRALSRQSDTGGATSTTAKTGR
jgi:transcriptional regulator with XRE-family HTH domain